jgi:hypothetical protein
VPPAPIIKFFCDAIGTNAESDHTIKGSIALDKLEKLLDK